MEEGVNAKTPRRQGKNEEERRRKTSSLVFLSSLGVLASWCSFCLSDPPDALDQPDDRPPTTPLPPSAGARPCRLPRTPPLPSPPPGPFRSRCSSAPGRR